MQLASNPVIVYNSGLAFNREIRDFGVDHISRPEDRYDSGNTCYNCSSYRNMPAGTEIGGRDLPEAAIDVRRCDRCENGGQESSGRIYVTTLCTD